MVGVEEPISSVDSSELRRKRSAEEDT
jgi:hypothetical protein